MAPYPPCSSSAQLPSDLLSFALPADVTLPRRRAPPPSQLTPLSSPVKQVLSPMKQRPGKRTAPEDEPLVAFPSTSMKRARTVEGTNEMDSDIIMLESQQPTSQAREALALE